MYYRVWIKSGGFFQTIIAQTAFLNIQPQQPAHPGRWAKQIQNGRQCLVTGKLTEQNGSNTGRATGNVRLLCLHVYRDPSLPHHPRVALWRSIGGAFTKANMFSRTLFTSLMLDLTTLSSPSCCCCLHVSRHT